MARWFFEPGHTAAELCVRHMMVTFVRGHFKDVHGTLDFDPEAPSKASVKVDIDVKKLWTGEPNRDGHLLSADFLDAERYPRITFESTAVARVSGNDFKVTGTLTIRGVPRTVTLDVRYLGKWRTPYNDTQVTRAGFHATTTIDRNDFGVSWNVPMEGDGVVIGDDVLIVIDAEAILEEPGGPRG